MLGSQTLPSGVSLGTSWTPAKSMLHNDLVAASYLVTHLLSFPLSSAEVLHRIHSLGACLKTADAQFGGDTLRGETKERWKELCERAVVEQDPARFVATIQELLQALENREERRRNVTMCAIRRKTRHLKEIWAMSNVLICSICHQPVAVENSKTDENGQALHEDCYLKRLLASLDDPPSPQHAE